jgi:hypothetical protein
MYIYIHICINITIFLYIYISGVACWEDGALDALVPVAAPLDRNIHVKIYTYIDPVNIYAYIYIDIYIYICTYIYIYIDR